MKIICENEEEYEDLMRGSKYLHDLTWFTRKGFKKEMNSIDMDNKVINLICGLYLSGKDFPNKDEVILRDFQ